MGMGIFGSRGRKRRSNTASYFEVLSILFEEQFLLSGNTYTCSILVKSPFKSKVLYSELSFIVKWFWDKTQTSSNIKELTYAKTKSVS